MKIRLSNIADARAMARIYVQAWRDTYNGILPSDYLGTMSIPEHEHAFLNDLHDNRIICFVAEEGGNGVVGFVTGGPERNGNFIYSGEIYTLYVLRSYQRQGIGFKLVSALAAHLNRHAIYSMMVWVLKQNPNRRFYEKINGVYLYSHRTQFAGTKVQQIAYGWIDTNLILAHL